MHDGRYPGEIDPFSPRVAVVWAPAGFAGALPATTIRCDPAPLLDSSAAGPAILTFRVHETLIFAARFASPAPVIGGVSDCAGQLMPIPSAAPFSAEPGIPAPAPAVTGARAPTTPCAAGDVGLAAARQTLDHWRSELHLTDSSGTVTGLTDTVTGTLVRITVIVERTVTLRYHLLAQREVLP